MGTQKGCCGKDADQEDGAGVCRHVCHPCQQPETAAAMLQVNELATAVESILLLLKALRRPLKGLY
ncbi:hypothetical protein DSO57_1002039 [Entomophthora muscae]|uniref:Uncharacterized protein n=1 Tax=Entomophthora muscae TaxID=34485 RepID=A0ACC2SBB1_9FUNG|nr:hypothetical protein DSO57_1002039 [Entomophthora muscae]